jgi:signal transduction histidine kinase
LRLEKPLARVPGQDLSGLASGNRRAPPMGQWRQRVARQEAEKRAFQAKAASHTGDSPLRERERLERQILEISGQERERIGQDLHDGLCQHLSGIKFKISLLEQKLQAQGRPEAEDARGMEELLNGAIQEARNVARGLHSLALEGRSLRSALEELAGSIRNLHGVACVCRFRHPVRVRDQVVATHLYRIAQEALNNAVRHGHATRIAIRLAGGRDGLTLTIRDNGCGFPSRPKRRTGLGLNLMSYRARAVGASLEVRPGRSAGTVVTCRLPRARPGKPDERGPGNAP